VSLGEVAKREPSHHSVRINSGCQQADSHVLAHRPTTTRAHSHGARTARHEMNYLSGRRDGESRLDNCSLDGFGDIERALNQHRRRSTSTWNNTGSRRKPIGSPQSVILASIESAAATGSVRPNDGGRGYSPWVNATNFGRALLHDARAAIRIPPWPLITNAFVDA
jgi:hypothetical protein